MALQAPTFILARFPSVLLGVIVAYLFLLFWLPPPGTAVLSWSHLSSLQVVWLVGAAAAAVVRYGLRYTVKALGRGPAPAPAPAAGATASPSPLSKRTATMKTTPTAASVPQTNALEESESEELHDGESAVVKEEPQFYHLQRKQQQQQQRVEVINEEDHPHHHQKSGVVEGRKEPPAAPQKKEAAPIAKPSTATTATTEAEDLDDILAEALEKTSATPTAAKPKEKTTTTATKPNSKPIDFTDAELEDILNSIN